MTGIEFFILPGNRPDDRLIMICRLVERAVQAGRTLFIHADDMSLLQALDDRLWTYRDTSFIAHQLQRSGASPTQHSEPVLLSIAEPLGDYQLLINLGTRVPAFFSRFERTFEVVNQAADVREAGRRRFRYYRERGYPLQYHHVG